MRIVPLGLRPEATPLVAGWLHSAWWQEEGWSLEATQAFLEAARGPTAPLTLLAEVDGHPAGTATFDVDDLPGRPDLSPWLSSVLVDPAYRGRGVASALANEVECAAAATGNRSIWLHTPDKAAFWAARGYQVLGEENWCGRATTLMVKRL